MVLRSREKATTRVSIVGGSGVSRRGGGRRFLRLARSGLRPASPTRSTLASNVRRTKREHLTVPSNTEFGGGEILIVQVAQGRAERGTIPAGHPLANAWADELELYPVLHALRTRPGLDGRLLLVLTDSASNAYRINAGAARYGTEALRMLQETYELADARGISLLAFWAPRCVNAAADALADPE